MSANSKLPDNGPYRSTNHLHETLRRLTETLHRANCRNELFETWAGNLARALSADLVEVLELITDNGDLLLRSGKGFPEDLYGRARVPGALLSQAGRAMLDPQGEPVVLDDFSSAHDWIQDHLVVSQGAKSGMAVKVRRGGRNYGALGVFYREPYDFQDDQVEFFSGAAELLAAGLKGIEKAEEAIAWRSRTELLNAGAALARVAAERNELLSAAVLAAVSGGAGGSQPIADWCFADALDTIGPLFKLERVAVDHAEGATTRLEKALSVPPAPTAPHGAPRAYATRRPELIAQVGESFRNEIARDPAHLRVLEELRPYSYLCVPVAGRERFYGALTFLRTETGNPVPYNEDDMTACAEFAALVGVAIEAGLPQPDLEEARVIVRNHSTPAATALNEPTKAEKGVLDLIGEGLNRKEISERLGVTYKTVNTHRLHVCQKLDLNPEDSDVKIIREARRCGWLAS